MEELTRGREMRLLDVFSRLYAKEDKIIAWWSAGVTSAVAVKMAIEKYGMYRVEPIYFEIDSHHEDNIRFKKECEEWYGIPIRVERSSKYKDQFDVIARTGYFNGPSGARCTVELKKNIRFLIESKEKYYGQVFGFEFSKKEINRAIRFSEQYDVNPLYPLIEKGITKPECLHYLESAGIRIPRMYELGYPNNNCIGCVKGGMGYWNKIRKDFPETFDRMKNLEDKMGNSCLKIPLSQLEENRGVEPEIIMPDCGNFCDIEFEELIDDRCDDIFENPKTIERLYK